MLQQRTSRNDSKRYSTHPVSGAKISPLSQNKHLWAVALLIFCCSMGLSICMHREAYAETITPSPSVTITMGDMMGRNTMAVQGHQSSQAFYVPVYINVKQSEYYTVSFTAESDLTDPISGNTIPSVSGPTSYNDLSNAWGFHYHYGDDASDDIKQNYEPAPSDGVTILTNSSDTVTERPYGTEVDRVLTLGYAANVRADHPAGNYRSRVVINVVASPLDTATTIHDIQYMQDMTPSICRNTRTPAVSAREHDDTGEKRLISDNYIPRTMLKDMRDNHWYIIEKFADDNCWMTENLALAGGTTITSANSNLMPAGSGLNAAGTGNVTYTGSYTLPAASASGPVYNGTETSGVDYTDPYVVGLTSISNSLYNTTSHTGNYYQWTTAVAGNAGGATGDGPDATEDICPKGWQLPKGGSSGQFQGLYNKYTNKTNFDQIWHMTSGSSYTGYYSGSSLRDSGSVAHWWSRTSNSASNAYYMNEDTSGYINPSHNVVRTHGFSVRCVARQ